MSEESEKEGRGVEGVAPSTEGKRPIHIRPAHTWLRDPLGSIPLDSIFPQQNVLGRLALFADVCGFANAREDREARGVVGRRPHHAAALCMGAKLHVLVKDHLQLDAGSSVSGRCTLPRDEKAVEPYQHTTHLHTSVGPAQHRPPVAARTQTRQHLSQERRALGSA